MSEVNDKSDMLPWEIEEKFIKENGIVRLHSEQLIAMLGGVREFDITDGKSHELHFNSNHKLGDERIKNWHSHDNPSEWSEWHSGKHVTPNAERIIKIIKDEDEAFGRDMQKILRYVKPNVIEIKGIDNFPYHTIDDRYTSSIDKLILYDVPVDSQIDRLLRNITETKPLKCLDILMVNHPYYKIKDQLPYTLSHPKKVMSEGHITKRQGSSGSALVGVDINNQGDFCLNVSGINANSEAPQVMSDSEVSAILLGLNKLKDNLEIESKSKITGMKISGIKCEDKRLTKTLNMLTKEFKDGIEVENCDIAGFAIAERLSPVLVTRKNRREMNRIAGDKNLLDKFTDGVKGLFGNRQKQLDSAKIAPTDITEILPASEQKYTAKTETGKGSRTNFVKENYDCTPTNVLSESLGSDKDKGKPNQSMADNHHERV